MVPLRRGRDTDLIEIPASWCLDDLPPMLFIKKSPNRHSFVNPRDIEQMWRDQFASGFVSEAGTVEVRRSLDFDWLLG
jgi:hypothetical protein